MLSDCVFIDPLPSTGNGEDHIENTSSNTVSIVACGYFGRCLEMGLHVTIYIYMYVREMSQMYRRVNNFVNILVWLLSG
jgi:hypothetical protein